MPNSSLRVSLFVFPSNIPNNIKLAVSHGMWKVRTHENRDSQLYGKTSNLIPGDFGIFYDSSESVYRVPFVATSDVGISNGDAPLEGGPYKYEFSLISLGSADSKRISLKDAPSGLKNAEKPLSVFARFEIDSDEWRRVLDDLTRIRMDEICAAGSSQSERFRKFLTVSDISPPTKWP